MGRADRITILLSVAALCVTIIGTSCSTNARIDDLGARMGEMNASLSTRIDDLSASLNARIDDLSARLNARIDDLSASLNARIDDLSASLNARIDALDRDLRELRAIVIDTAKVAAPPAD